MRRGIRRCLRRLKGQCLARNRASASQYVCVSTQKSLYKATSGMRTENAAGWRDRTGQQQNRFVSFSSAVMDEPPCFFGHGYLELREPCILVSRVEWKIFDRPVADTATRLASFQQIYLLWYTARYPLHAKVTNRRRLPPLTCCPTQVRRQQEDGRPGPLLLCLLMCRSTSTTSYRPRHSLNCSMADWS